jgi:hypothetical protein
MTRLAARALLAALSLGLMWVVSLHVYDRHKLADALGWRAAVLAGETPYAWPLDAPSDLAGGHGVERFTWRDGVLRGDLDDPYLVLNLRGRVIDARRYTRLRLRLFNARDDGLQILHEQGDPAVVHASRRLPVRAGWQVLEFDLAEQRWWGRPLPGGDRFDSSWGGANGRVTALRIDPVRNGAFALDWIELLDPGQKAPADKAVHPFTRLDDPLFDRLAAAPGEIGFIADARLLRTPATAHHARMAIAERFPAAIVFPRLPPPGAKPGQPAAPPVAPAVLLGLALLAGLFAGGRHGAVAALAGAAALIAALGAWLFLEPGFGAAGKALLALPVLLLAWRIRPPEPGRWLRFDARAWLALAPLLLAAAAAILWLPRSGPADSPLAETLAIYLGWAALQQVVVAGLVFERLRGPLAPWAVTLGATAFAWLHLPNFELMAGTFLFGLYLLSVQRRFPNLPALAATHALVAVAVNSAAPYLFWLSREIGPRYLQTL